VTAHCFSLACLTNILRTVIEILPDPTDRPSRPQRDCVSAFVLSASVFSASVFSVSVFSVSVFSVSVFSAALRAPSG
jgi:hypothetical protein